MPKGLNLKRAAGKTARVWLQGRAEGWPLGKPWCFYLSRKRRPPSCPPPIARHCGKR